MTQTFDSRIHDHLTAVFAAHDQIDAAEQDLLDHCDQALVRRAILDALAQCLDASSDDASAWLLKLEWLVHMCVECAHAETAHALITVLDHDHPGARAAGGDALTELAYERYREVAEAVEARLDKPEFGPALLELPWILKEVHEPSPVSLLRRFLKHSHPEVVASAIEAALLTGEHELVTALEALRDDKRVVSLEDEEGNEGPPTYIGELASEAAAALEHSTTPQS